MAKHYMDINNTNELKHTRVWIHDICKKSTLLTKKYWDNTQLHINIVINGRLKCNVNEEFMYMILVVSNYAFLITIMSL